MDAPQKLVRLHFNLMGASNVVNPWRMLLSKDPFHFIPMQLA